LLVSHFITECLCFHIESGSRLEPIGPRVREELRGAVARGAGAALGGEVRG